MTIKQVDISWPDGHISKSDVGLSWLEVAKSEGISIPTGCLGGSCGACEIEVNGKIVRACINVVESYEDNKVEIKMADDPYW